MGKYWNARETIWGDYFELEKGDTPERLLNDTFDLFLKLTSNFRATDYLENNSETSSMVKPASVWLKLN